MSDNKQNNEPKFNEALAYEELRMIFVIAIETQDFQTLEARIAAWERKYPLEDFVDTEIVRKIKAILNKDFLQRLIGDYLAAKVLHEQEKQQEAYMKLKEIIDTAKKSKDYFKAQKQVKSWKDDLYSQELSLSNFNKYYKAKICTLLLMPSKEIEKQEEASRSLKNLVDRSKDMDSESLSLEISDWQNKYTLDDFPTKLQTQLNEITTEVFESISQKANQESALRELHELVESNPSDPLDAISSVLAKYDLSKFDSSVVEEINVLTQEATYLPVLDYNQNIGSTGSATSLAYVFELDAVNNLKDILNKNSRNLDTLINWIYINRNMNFSEYSIEEITKAFYAAGFKIPEQASYSIPDINEHLSYKDFSEIDRIRENVILNYLGLLSHREKISSIASENIAHLNSHKKTSEISPSQEIEIVKNPSSNDKSDLRKEFSFSLPVFDNEPKLNSEETIDPYTSKRSKTLQDNDEVVIQNIFAEDDLLQDPLETYTIPSSSVEVVPQYSDETIAITSKDNGSGTKSKSTLTPQDISDDVPVTVNDDEKAKVLSNQDEENITKAYDLSTYIVVAVPILEMALENRYISKIKNKPKDNLDYDMQKK